jgi:Polyketide cyclase / dehydrase and lipid transport
MNYSILPEKRKPDDVIISSESIINAPINVVFDVVTDIELFVELEKGVKSVTITSDIKEGRGMKSHWVLIDQKNGEEWDLDEEIIFSDRPYQYGYIGYAGGKDYSGVHTLTQNPDGTTHHLFNEAFYFDIDVDIYNEVVGGMVANVKKVAEERAGKL